MLPGGPCPASSLLPLSFLNVVFSYFSVICPRISLGFELLLGHLWGVAQISSDVCGLAPGTRGHMGVSPSEEGHAGKLSSTCMWPVPRLPCLLTAWCSLVVGKKACPLRIWT